MRKLTYENRPHFLRVGILGGTFNPVHNGHLHIAREFIKKLHLDKVTFVPSYMPPHKRIEDDVTVNDRLRMLRLALAGNSKFEISLHEIKRKGTSYSIRTARYFKKRFGKSAKLFFLIGADSFVGLKKWKDVASLVRLLQFAVVPRPGFKMKISDYPDILRVDIAEKDISSRQIRRLVREAKPIKQFVPTKVYKYIERERLYQ